MSSTSGPAPDPPDGSEPPRDRPKARRSRRRKGPQPCAADPSSQPGSQDTSSSPAVSKPVLDDVQSYREDSSEDFDLHMSAKSSDEEWTTVGSRSYKARQGGAPKRRCVAPKTPSPASSSPKSYAQAANPDAPVPEAACSSPVEPGPALQTRKATGSATTTGRPAEKTKTTAAAPVTQGKPQTAPKANTRRAAPKASSPRRADPASAVSLPPGITTRDDVNGSTTWTKGAPAPSPQIYSCIRSCPATFPAEDLLFQHFTEKHCVDGVSWVVEEQTQALGFDICPTCSKVYKSGCVHKNDRCPIPVHVDPLFTDRLTKNIRLFRDRFVKHNFGSLIPGRDMPFPKDIFTRSAPTLDYFPGGEDLRAEFRRIFIVLVQSLKSGKLTDEGLFNVWTLLFSLPQLLLAIPKGKDMHRFHSTAAVVSDRIRKFFNLDFAQLNTELRDIIEATEIYHSSPKPPANADATIRKVISLIKKSGEVGKAGKRLDSDCTLADLNDDRVVQEVKELLITDADQPTPAQCTIKPNETCPELLPEHVTQAVASMKRSAPGFSGWNKIHFSILTDSPEGLSALTFVANAIYARSLPEELNHLITHCKLTALQKPNGGGIRPICAADCFIRLIAKCTVIIEQDFIAKRMEPLQVAVGTRGGAEIAIHGIRAHLDTNKDHIAVAIDLRNAFGSVSRHAIAKALNSYTYESTAYSRWFFNNFGAPVSSVALPSGEILTYNRGVPQGGPTSMQWFCLAIQHLLLKAQGILGPSKGTVISYADDTFLIGEPKDVFKAFKLFTSSAVDIGLHHRPDKCRILAPFKTLSADDLQLASDCGFRSLPETGIIVLGSPVGRPDREIELANNLVNPALFEKIAAIDDKQCRLLVLRYCIATKYNHLARTIPPDQAEACLKRIDSLTARAVMELLEVKTLPVAALLQIALPIAMGGLSLKRLERESHVDYYASASTSHLHWRNSIDADHCINQVHKETATRTSKALAEALKKCQWLLDTTRDTQQFSTVGTKNTEQWLPKLPSLNLPKDLTQLMTGTTPHPVKLQKTLSQYSARVYFRMILAEAKAPAHRIQLLDNTTATPSLVLLALPTEPGLQMKNKELVIMLRQYLSLPIEPVLGLPERPINCACSKPSRPAKAAGDHLFNCNHQGSYTYRHEVLKTVVNSAIRSVGIPTEIERRVLSTPGHRTNRSRGRYDNDNQKRYDIVAPALTEDFKLTCIDITMVSHVAKDITAAKNFNSALVAANNATRLKHNKYDQEINTDTECLFPLAAQSNGALHPNYRKLFEQLATRVNRRPPIHANWAAPSFASYWMQRTSCALWRESARTVINVSSESRRLNGRNPIDALPDENGEEPDHYDVYADEESQVIEA